MVITFWAREPSGKDTHSAVETGTNPVPEHSGQSVVSSRSIVVLKVETVYLPVPWHRSHSSSFAPQFEQTSPASTLSWPQSGHLSGIFYLRGVT
jgi:hypothetical protein